MTEGGVVAIKSVSAQLSRQEMTGRNVCVLNLFHGTSSLSWKGTAGKESGPTGTHQIRAHRHRTECLFKRH